MRNRLAVFAAVAACLTTGVAAAGQGYDFTSEAGPQVAWIIADDSGYPDIQPTAVTVAAEMLALSDDQLTARTYQPEKLGDLSQPLGYAFASATGPQMAWIPADSSGYTDSEFLASATAGAEQLGAVPDEEPTTR